MAEIGMEYALLFADHEGAKGVTMKRDSRPTRPIPLFKSGEKAKDPSSEGPPGKLIIIYGADLGRQYRLGPERVLIGRQYRSDILIEDSSVSREHAAIERKDGRFILEDLKSTNGTFINGESTDVRVLNHGDKIRVGNTVLQFIAEE
jgi:pSer/pThr/pTyr-binding forkhead associated (FHA) protein